MQSMELGAKVVESSGSFVVEGEDLIAQLAEIHGSGGLVLGAESLPAGLELALVGPLLDRYVSGGIINYLIDNVSRGGSEYKGAFECTQGSGEMLVNLDELGFVSAHVFLPVTAECGLLRLRSRVFTESALDGSRFEQVA